MRSKAGSAWFLAGAFLMAISLVLIFAHFEHAKLMRGVFLGLAILAMIVGIVRIGTTRVT